MRIRTPLLAAAAAATMLAGAALPALAADSGDTTTTFTLGAAGDLSISSPATKNLTAVTAKAAGDSSVSGLLGTTTVSDLLSSAANWTVTAQSSSFVQVDGNGVAVVGGTTVPATAVDYDAGTATATGTGDVTATGSAQTDISGDGKTVVTGNDVVGNNGAYWNPTLTVNLPGNALAGDYKGTVTTSVN